MDEIPFGIRKPLSSSSRFSINQRVITGAAGAIIAVSAWTSGDLGQSHYSDFPSNKPSIERVILTPNRNIDLINIL